MATFVRGIGYASRNVRPSKTKPLGPAAMFMYLKEKSTLGFTISVRYTMVALSSSQEASAASFSRLSLAPRWISLPLSSSASVMVESCVAPRGIDDAAIWREGKGGNVVINIEQRLFEIGALRASRRQRAAANYGANERAQISHPAKAANGAGAGHGVGWGAVYVWQQGSRAGVNSVTSTRVSSGS